MVGGPAGPRPPPLSEAGPPARRAVQAARAREEAASLLELAQTVLGGADSPAAVLEHLTRTHGGQAELQERVAGRWIRAASSGVEGSLAAASRIDIRADLILLVTGQTDSATPARCPPRCCATPRPAI